MMHEAFGEEQQFRPHLGWVLCLIQYFFVYSSKDPHNMKVKTQIKEELFVSKENEYSVCVIERKWNFL